MFQEVYDKAQDVKRDYYIICNRKEQSTRYLIIGRK